MRINKLISKKKGITLEDMYPAILTILLIGIILGVGLYVLTLVRVGIQEEFTGFAPDQNITLTNPTDLNSSLAKVYVSESSVSAVWSNGTATTITNFTVGEHGGIVTWGGDVVAEGSDNVNISYKYKYDRDNPSKAVTTAIGGTDDFADWIAIIVVVLAAAIILGFVFKSFRGGRVAV